MGELLFAAYVGAMLVLFGAVLLLLRAQCTCYGGQRPNVQDMIFVFQLGLLATVVWVVFGIVSIFRG